MNIDQTLANADLSIISLILSSDAVVKGVLGILLCASIWSWAIIISKLLHYYFVKRKMKNFEDIFWSGQILDELYEKIKKTIDNPLSAIFVSALNECKKSSANKSSVKSENLRIGYKARVLEVMHLSRNREIGALEAKLGFLATINSSATFIGLFGTVWGIIHSFQSIASSKNATLAVVAPGIAEALFVTAVGLFVAIPAGVFYNYLVSEIDIICSKIDDFIGELNNLISRAIDEEKM